MESEVKCPVCGGSKLKLIQNKEHGLFVFCETPGCHTFPVQPAAPPAPGPRRLIQLAEQAGELAKQMRDAAPVQPAPPAIIRNLVLRVEAILPYISASAPAQTMKNLGDALAEAKRMI